MAKSRRYDNIGINESVLKNIELTNRLLKNSGILRNMELMNMMYNSDVLRNMELINTFYNSGILREMELVNKAYNSAVLKDIELMSKVYNSSILKDVELMSRLYSNRILNMIELYSESSRAIGELGVTSKIMQTLEKTLKHLEPTLKESSQDNELLREIKSIIMLPEFDDDSGEEVFINAVTQESYDEEAINDLCETIQNEADNNRLTFESLLKIFHNKYLEFKDKKPYTAKLILYILNELMMPILVGLVVWGITTTVVKVYEEPNEKSVYQEINYNINNNYYIEVCPTRYYTRVEIRDKTTNELLNNGFISKVKLNEIKNLEEQSKDKGLEE